MSTTATDLISRLSTMLLAEFCLELKNMLAAYAFVMESDVFVDVPAGEAYDLLDQNWDNLPDYNCPAYGCGKRLGRIGVDIFEAGEFTLVGRDLVEDGEHGPELQAVPGYWRRTNEDAQAAWDDQVW